MPPRFKYITEAEFDGWAHTNNFKIFDASSIGVKTFEKCYYYEINEKSRIIIFSSVDVRDDMSRALGEDAIRTYIYLRTDDIHGDSWFKYIELSRTYHTKGWRENLLERVKQAQNTINKTLCPKCNNPLILRMGKYGSFYSCVMWSRTRCEGKAKYE